MKASETQVGGQHYKDYPIQPAEFCQRNKLTWCESNVVKLVTRHRDKGGVQDIDKAIHYLQLLKEWEYPQPEQNTPNDEWKKFSRELPIREPRRGEKEVYAFAEAMIETLNLPKNAAKGGWDGLNLGTLMNRLQEEEAELNDALFCEEGMNLDPKSEATDVGAYAMMIYDKLVKMNR